MSKKVIIGSRGSDLALWQANFFQDSLTAIGVDSEIKIITTKGDRIQDLSFDKIEGKGYFTKEIESALLEGSIDVAIHSHKDLETQMPPGLIIAGVSQRANPSDVILIRPNAIDHTMPFGFKKSAVVGTSSARRKSQILALRGDVEIKDIRGNVPTRVNKLRNGDFDAILLAAAGLERLQLDVSDLKKWELDPRIFVPAPAQGVLAYQCRSDDAGLIETIKRLDDRSTRNAIQIERALLSGFGGGCHIPIGVYAKPQEDHFNVRVSFGKDWTMLPKRIRFSASNVEDALSRFDKISKMSAPESVLITKHQDEASHIRRACRQFDVKVHQTSFIEVEPVKFQLPNDFDWIFFASSNAVDAFFQNVSEVQIKDKRTAVFGESTARALHRYLDKIDFIPNAGQPNEVAIEISKVVGDQRVLFPSSNQSLGSIAKLLSPDQVIEVETYRTNIIARKLENLPEAAIFYSPSNVTGFVDGGNDLGKLKKVIAIGNSAAAEIKKHGAQPLIADIPHQAELFALLCS